MRPKIVICESLDGDGIALLESFAEVVDGRGMGRAHLLHELVPSCQAVVVKSATVIDRAFLDCAPQLRAIGRAGTGLDNIDLDAAKERGIAVLTVEGANAGAAADFTLALILGLCRHLPQAVRMVDHGDFRRHLIEGRELSALRVGIAGLGRVGMGVAERLRPFGCALYGYDPDRSVYGAFESLGGTLVPSLPALAERSHLLTIHMPLTPETRGIVDRSLLAHLPHGAFLVNMARGAIIDDGALLEALDSGQIAAAALDVLEPEPPFDADPAAHAYSHALLEHPNVWMTPHMGASTRECQRLIAVRLAEKLRETLLPGEA